MRLAQSWFRVGVVLALATAHHMAMPPGEATAAGRARVSATSTSVGEGLTSVTDVMISDVAGLYAADVQLRFDPDVIQVVDVDPAVEGVQIQLGGFLDPGIVVRNNADNEAGTVWFAVAQLNPSTPKSGEGRLFSVIFTGRTAGAQTEVAVALAMLATRDGEEIPADLVSGVVRVVDRAEAPATPTMAPIVRPTLVAPTAAAGESGQPSYATPVRVVEAVVPTSRVPGGEPASQATPAAAESDDTDIAPSSEASTSTTMPSTAPAAGWTEPPAATTPGAVSATPPGELESTPWVWWAGAGAVALAAIAFIALRRKGPRS